MKVKKKSDLLRLCLVLQSVDANEINNNIPIDNNKELEITTFSTAFEKVNNHHLSHGAIKLHSIKEDTFRVILYFLLTSKSYQVFQ